MGHFTLKKSAAKQLSLSVVFILGLKWSAKMLIFMTKFEHFSNFLKKIALERISHYRRIAL